MGVNSTSTPANFSENQFLFRFTDYCLFKRLAVFFVIIVIVLN